MDHKDIGWYIVKNQYHQSGNAFWDGEKWTMISMIKGSTMLYDDQKIVSYKEDIQDMGDMSALMMLI